jgi:hypothetical protein
MDPVERPHKEDKKSLPDVFKENIVVFVLSAMLMAGVAGFQFARTIQGAGATLEPNAPSSATDPVQKPEEIEVTRFVVNCDGSGHLCNEYFSVAFYANSNAKFKYYASESMCTSVKLHVYVDRTLITSTDYLGYSKPPNDSRYPDSGLIDLGPLRPGSHTLRIQAEGDKSGCGADGTLKSWGGSIRLLLG